MSRRNRKIKEASVVTVCVSRVALLVLALAGTSLMWWYQDSRCNFLTREIGAAKLKLERLDKDLVREQGHISRLMTPEHLEEMWTRLGIDMREPTPKQIVRMNRAGTPLKGQYAVVKAVSRNARSGGQTAENTPRENRRVQKTSRR